MYNFFFNKKGAQFFNDNDFCFQFLVLINIILLVDFILYKIFKMKFYLIFKMYANYTIYDFFYYFTYIIVKKIFKKMTLW